ncbi:MAG: MATE family efflux transporter [Verrucomicrobiae bacterium]|nr:MATE family efflux transporter [Verrucomicrobiae bacterium]MCP5540553.1 MATE family efflux transporter [Akkermansiaceae bacterium]
MVFQLSWPTVATFSVLSLRSLVDVWLAGRLGRNDLAALAPAQLILMLILSFGFGSLFIVNAHVSRSKGAGRSEEAGVIAWQGIWFSISYGLVALFFWKAGPALLTLFGHPREVFSREVLYFNAALASVIWQMMSFAATNFFFGIERPRIPMFLAPLALGTHTLIGAGLAFGQFGLPRLEMAGIGWATTVSSAIHSVAMVGWMLLDRRLRRFGAFRFRLAPGVLLRVWRDGIPVGARDFLDNFIWSVTVIWLIGKLGPTPMATATVLLACNDILMLPCDGLGAAMVTLIGRTLGLRRFWLADSWRRFSWVIAGIYSGLAGTLFFVFRRPILAFLANDPEVTEMAVDLAYFVPLLLFLYASYSVFDHALCAACDNVWPTVTNLICSVLILGIGGWVFLAFYTTHGPVAVWWLLTVNLAIIVGAFWRRWKLNNWRQFVVFEKQ